MARIQIEDLGETAMSALQRRADQHGVSVESEARDILQNVAMRPQMKSTGWATRINARFAHLDMPEFEHLYSSVEMLATA